MGIGLDVVVSRQLGINELASPIKSNVLLSNTTETMGDHIANSAILSTLKAQPRSTLTNLSCEGLFSYQGGNFVSVSGSIAVSL